MSISRTFKSGLVLLALVAASGVFAAAPWFANGPKRDIVTLVVTGNYQSPRLMAELILYESRQPYLLLPTPESKDQRIIYVQAKGPAYEIQEKDLPRFVNFLFQGSHSEDPKGRIFVLGDERYVPAKYIKLLDPSIPVVRIEGDDWDRIADQATLLLGLSNLGGDYKRLHEKITGKGRLLRPSPRTHQELKPVDKAPTAAEDIAAENVEFSDSAAAPAEEPAKPAK